MSKWCNCYRKQGASTFVKVKKLTKKGSPNQAQIIPNGERGREGGPIWTRSKKLGCCRGPRLLHTQRHWALHTWCLWLTEPKREPKPITKSQTKHDNLIAKMTRPQKLETGEGNQDPGERVRSKSEPHACRVYLHISSLHRQPEI